MGFFAKKEILPLSLIFTVILVTAIFYPVLPEKVPSHWNIEGEVDSWSSKNFTVLFFPSLVLGLYLLMTLLPKIDPLKENYLKFIGSFFWLKVIFVAFFSLLYFYTLWAASGNAFSINNLIIPAVSFLFVTLGFFLPKTKRNYFVGIRTPWTLSSDEVWDKTHRFSRKVFIAGGLTIFLGVFFKDLTPWFFLATILLAVLFPIIYSYLVFHKIGGKDKKGII
ncbi:MAG: SdpI family protein [Candidatus Pacebacteria bacterium]|nr:SdpI family protein [Candidatus Paceibacterota bacterium]